MLDKDSRQLIATIYAATLAPHAFDEMVDDMEAQVTRIVTAATGCADVSDVVSRDAGPTLDAAGPSDLAHHVEIARRIQERIGLHAADRDMLDLVLGSVPNPAVVFDQDEQIVRRNALAERMAYGAGTELSDIFADPEPLGDIRRAVGEMRNGRSFAAVPVSLDGDSRLRGCVIVKQVGPAGDAAGRKRLYMLSPADFTFDDTVSAHFKSAYALTDAETAVAIQLARGARAGEIARRRGVSQQTVRTQIKAVKSKTHVRDLPDLVRLLCGFSLGIALPAADTGARVPDGGTHPSLRTVRLPDGRRLDYLLQGHPGGSPVLLFHNVPYGVELPAAAIAFAARQGLRIVAPYRPGHGESDPLPALDGRAYLDRVARDTRLLCDALSIAKAKLLGFAGGSAFAVRFAALHPDRVSDIVMVSHAPMWRAERYRALAPRHRVLSLLVTHMPRLATLLAGAMLAHVSKHDHKAYAQESCNGSRADLKALDNPEYVALMAHDIRFGLKQGPDAFVREWALMALDLTDEARALPHRLHLLHGADDRVLTPAFSKQFAETVRQTTLEIVEDAGHHLFYSHWQRVLEALVRPPAPSAAAGRNPAAPATRTTRPAPQKRRRLQPLAGAVTDERPAQR